MPGLKVKTDKGEEGKFDPIEFLRSTVGEDVRIKNIDVINGNIDFESQAGSGQFKPQDYLKSQGVSVTAIEDAVNTPETAVDSSPLSLMQRNKLGLVTREAPQVKRLLNSLGEMMGAKGVVPVEEQDLKETELNKSRILAALKGEYDDVKFVNGEAMLKKGMVWYKANAEGLDKGDIAEFIGQSGLNIAGSIALGSAGAIGGSLAGPLGSLAGGATGAIVGALGSEALEEAIAIGISDGKIDVNAAMQDITTEGLFAAFGEGAGKGLQVAGKGIKAGAQAIKGKLSSKAAAEVTKTIADETLSRNISGMNVVARESASGVKDIIAKVMSTLNADVNEKVLRTAIDSGENAAIVSKNIKINNSVPIDAPNPLNTQMEKLFEEGLDAANKTIDNAYESIRANVRSTLDRGPSAFQLDLDEFSKYLANASENIADETARKALKTAQNFTERHAEKAGITSIRDPLGLPRDVKKPVISGSSAFDFLENLDSIIDHQMRTLGFFKKTKERSALEQSLAEGLFDVSDFIGNKLNEAYKWSNVDKPMQRLTDLYRETRSGLRVLKRRFYSDVNKVKFLEQAAKGENDDFIRAFDTLDVAMKEIGGIVKPKGKQFSSAELLTELRLLQAGKELAPVFTVPKGKAIPVAIGAAALAAAIPAAVPLAAAALSPRLNFLLSRAAAKGATSVATGIAGAKDQARRLLTVAHASGMFNRMNMADKLALLKDENAYRAIMQTVGRVANENIGQTDRVMDAAIKRSDKAPERQQ